MKRWHCAFKDPPFPYEALIFCHVSPRHKHTVTKTKRRITPTLVKSQFAGHNIQFSQGASNASSFLSSNLQSTADLRQALKEDRKQIQKEISIRRKKHMHITSNKKLAVESVHSSGWQKNLPDIHQDQKDKGIVTARRSNPCVLNNASQSSVGSVQDSFDQKQMLGRPGHFPGDFVLGGVYGTMKADSSSSSVSTTSRSSLERQVVSTLTDQNALNDLSEVYSRVIKGYTLLIHFLYDLKKGVQV